MAENGWYSYKEQQKLLAQRNNLKEEQQDKLNKVRKIKYKNPNKKP